MKPAFTYPGKELELFGKANNWKKYVAAIINKYIQGDVAEVGAGTGNFSTFLHSDQVTSWTYVEPDENFRDILQHKIADNHLRAGTVHEKLSDTSIMHYDTLLYMDVLEHIQNDREEITMMIKNLKPGGHIVILAPAYQYLYSEFDKEIGHFRRYTKKQLANLFHQPDNIVYCKYVDTAGFITSFANRFLLRQKYPTQQQISIWNTLLIPLSVLTDKILLHSFGRSLILVWRNNRKS